MMMYGGVWVVGISIGQGIEDQRSGAAHKTQKKVEETT